MKTIDFVLENMFLNNMFGFMVLAGWDTEFATKVYQEQVKVLAEHQVGTFFFFFFFVCFC